ncbi:MAG TPA: DUF1365 domain-containing protein [Candidatus Lustribacter sp.]|nr:DUF1365 domain-containing protein [Candidatus Lustribacter sp.]
MSAPATPRLYATTIQHTRTGPLAHAFTSRSYSWLVDLDALPRLGGLLGWFARFEARDHVGDPGATLRANIDSFLGDRGVDLRGGRVLMLASARVAGYVFNPISVFWCLDPDEALRCVVVEVHNTYGGRHAYLVQTDDRGRATVDKELYVSPFNDVSGHYELTVPLPGERVRLSVVLRRPGHPPFVARVAGVTRPWGRRTLVGLLVRHPLEPLMVSARIRRQGIGLWLRRLPVQPRPASDSAGRAARGSTT